MAQRFTRRRDNRRVWRARRAAKAWRPSTSPTIVATILPLGLVRVSHPTDRRAA